ncbi:hypothetical protein QTP88_004082 [Uroleucon formosanum]
MAGSIVDNAAIYKKSFTYIPPTPPSELIDSTNYTLNFMKRKFIHIGIDPTDMFKVIVHIITPSRYVSMSTEFLQRIFSLMELIRLQYLEWCIFETIVQKSTIIQSIILKHFDIFTEYIDKELSKVESSSKTSEEMATFIKNLRDDHIIANSPKNYINFISQLKMYACTQLAEYSIQLRNREISPELFNGNTSSPTSNIVAHNTFNTQNEVEEGDVFEAKLYDSIDAPQSFDVNDGPDFFNMQYLSDPNQSTYATFRNS